MPEAARLEDSIQHTSAATGLLIGLAAGAALAIGVIAVVGTGGAAAPFIAAGIAAGAAGGGLSGAYIGEVVASPTGMIATGSNDVFIGGYNGNAARASPDLSVSCSGVWPASPHVPTPIAEGSSTVFINNFMAARKGDSLCCGATIAMGCSTVIIGGATDPVPGLKVAPEIPGWLTNTLWGVMIGGAIIATGGAVLAAAPVAGWGAALGAAVFGWAGGIGGGLAFGWVGGEIGEAIGGIFGNPELGRRIGEVALGTAGGIGCGIAGARFGARVGARPEGTRFGPAAISRQKQAGHIKGSPQHKNRIRQNKPTSTFDDSGTADALTRQAWARGRPVQGRPNVRDYDFRRPVGTGPGGGRQSRVRVHQDRRGRIHGHPSGPGT